MKETFLPTSESSCDPNSLSIRGSHCIASIPSFDRAGFIIHFRRLCSSLIRAHYVPSYSFFVSLIFAVLCSAGCTPKADFQPNFLSAASALQSQDQAEVRELASSSFELTLELFGTADAPKWPKELEEFVNMEEVQRCAGAVGRQEAKVERGLYRKHCVQCHGITGDGAGPAASLLAPYPRDFRRGTFKFKSTPIGSKPLRSDLTHTIDHGIAGTSMPGFSSLRLSPEFAKDIDALTDYVIYLSIRGEVERRLSRELIDSPPTYELALRAANSVVESWQRAQLEAVIVPTIQPLQGEELAESIHRGKELFASEKTGCIKCHGPQGLGDGVSQDYDEWTKDWTIRIGIDPASKSEWKVMKPFGALKPVLNRSRNLHLGGLRGGRSLTEIYKRIKLGIDGAPMPAANVADDNPHSISASELLDLVRFIGSIAKIEFTTREPNNSPPDSPAGTAEPMREGNE